MDHEVSIQSAEGASGRTNEGSDPADLRSARCGDSARSGVAGPHPHAAISTGGSVASEVGQYLKSRSSRRLQDEFPDLRKRYWGQPLWARGYFCATVGAVDEATIREYIENQKWDQDDQGFKITAPAEP